MFLLRLVDWSATGAVILNAVIYPLAILAARRYRIPGAVKRVEVTGELGLGLLAVHLLAVPIGVWWSYVVGLSIGLAWNALLWVLRAWQASGSARPRESGDPGPMSR